MRQVDGKLSVACYLSSVDKCYQRLCRKAGLQKQSSTGEAAAFSLADVDFCVMHVGQLSQPSSLFPVAEDTQ